MAISEKTLARASDRKEVSPDEMLEARVDMTLSHEKTGPPFFQVVDGLGIPIWDGEKWLSCPNMMSSPMNWRLVEST
jgi:homoaconitase/3-isopropylmalate dehydratase large subunit